MREDLAKLTTEKERYGSSFPSKKWGGRVKYVPDPEHEYEDEIGGVQSSSIRNFYNSKSFSDVLNPLRGTLHKNVGRPWDDIFSEFCQVMDRRSTSGHHIWTHLMQYVSVKTYMGIDGVVYELSKYGEADTNEYYVHPYTGLLCHKPYGRYGRWNVKRKPKFENKVFITEDKLSLTIPYTKENNNTRYELRKVGRYRREFMAWFFIKTETIIEDQWSIASFADIESGRYLKKKWKQNEDGKIYICYSHKRVISDRRSANKKEIARINQFLQRIYSK